MKTASLVLSVAVAIAFEGIASGVTGQPPLPPMATPEVTNAAAVMVAKEFKGADGGTLRYRIHSPAKPDAGRKYPLVLFLHGAGERGDDNAMQLVWCVWPILSYMKKNGFDGYVVAPQCPAKMQWVDTPWSLFAHKMPEKPSKPMSLVMELIDDAVANLQVDASRVYVIGLSMGGYGTWDIVQRRPEVFAAAIPICGGGDSTLAWKIRNVPIWAFHGDKDDAVPVERSRQMVSALWQCNGKVRYREYPGVGHGCWSRTYHDSTVLDWFFSQSTRSRMECVVSPESQGVSSRAIQDWIEACENDSVTNRQRGYVHGFVILRHGHTIAEGTWAPQNTLEKPHMLYSHSKSFTSTAIGFLVDDGKLDLDRRVVSFFPDKTPDNPSENLRQMRVRDLLTMNIGADHGDAERDDIKGDWVKAMLHNKIDREPGTGFKYDSGATHLLAAIVEKISGKTLMEFLKERLFDPLGMTSPWSTVSPTGIACGGWGMNMTTRDMARFGQFLLQEGRWNGRQLLSREWVRLATARQTWSGSIVIHSQTIGSGSDWNQGYGFQFWRCRHGAYRADGAMGQLTVVFPEQDAVVSVHAGLSDMQRELDLIWKYLLPAFGPDAMKENAGALKKLRTKCASLALPLDGNFECAFEGFDKASFKAVPGGWTLTLNGRTLNVGDGKWAVTSWKFDDTNVEPPFVNCGTHDIAAAGRLLPNGSLSVTWQFLGGIRHGRFSVSAPHHATVK